MRFCVWPIGNVPGQGIEMTFRIIRYAITLGALYCVALETGPATFCVMLGIIIILEIHTAFLRDAGIPDPIVAFMRRVVSIAQTED